LPAPEESCKGGWRHLSSLLLGPVMKPESDGTTGLNVVQIFDLHFCVLALTAHCTSDQIYSNDWLLLQHLAQPELVAPV
jgi:hypothetical protein